MTFAEALRLPLGCKQETPTTYPARIIIRHNGGRFFAEYRYASPKVGKINPTELMDFLLRKGLPCGGNQFQTDCAKVLEAWNTTCDPEWKAS